MKKVYVFSHTHWDREWYLSQCQFQFLLGKTVDEVLETLESDPSFACFMIDGQTSLIEDYLEIRPDAEKRIKDLVHSGRLIIGPWYTMPDLWIPGGEALIRNLLQGLLDCESYGVAQPKLGYVPDSFGHIEQMPQILNGFEIDNYLFSRGEPLEGHGEFLEFVWVGPDGKSRVRAHWLPGEYGNAKMLEPASNEDKLRRQIQYCLQHYSERSFRSDLALLCNGIDHIWIQKDLPTVLEKARELFPDCQFIQGSALDYVTAFGDQSPALPERKGTLRGRRLNSKMWHGTWSSRIDTKIANARAESVLQNLAEPLAALLGLFGEPVRTNELRMAWRMLLKNHAHDSICGCSIDRVHADVNRRFTHVLEISEMVAGEALEFFNGKAIRQDQPRLLRYTGLNGADGCIEFITDQKSFVDLHLEDSNGKRFPVQILSTRDIVRRDWIHEGGLEKPNEACWDFTEVRAVAMLPPASPCGIEVYEIAEGAYRTVDDPVIVEPHSLENKLLRVRVNDDGTLTVLHKPTGRVFEGLLELTDEADLGGGYAFVPLQGDVALSSKECKATVEVTERGPLRGALSIYCDWHLPVGLNDDRKSRSPSRVACKVNTEIRLETGSETLLCCTRLVNAAKDHRVRINLPTDIKTSVAHTERAFVVSDEDTSGYTADPGQDSHPMGNWVSVSDDLGGVAFVGQGLHEFTLSAHKTGGTLAVTLLRSVPFVFECGSWATPEAQLLGELTYEYALMFHCGGWRLGRIAQRAARFVWQAVAEVRGDASPPWKTCPHATYYLGEKRGDEETPIDSHRSSWRRLFGHRDGWRRWEESRLPQGKSPDRILS
ncbi:MAG: hypothetical protein KAU28_06540, partial [Phycisphaerae bacterium]|nr:hypothetical protein [Phycisphaerae bacterium]